MAERAHPEDSGFKDGLFGWKRNRYKRKLYERYGFCNRFTKGKRVLDIPCGTGWGTSLLRGAAHVTGIDISQEAVAYAQRRFPSATRVFTQGQMQRIPCGDDAFDLVICLEGLEHVDRPSGEAFLQECRRVLKKDGKLIITCPVEDENGNTTGNPYHLSEYPEKELIGLLSRTFRILLLERTAGPDGPEYRAVLSNTK